MGDKWRRSCFLIDFVVVLSFSFLHLSTGCSSGEFRCVANGQCIPLHYKCDGEGDCPDSSDENDCRMNACQPNEFPCQSGQKCTPYLYRCDDDNDCLDGSDEQCEPSTDNFLIVVETGRLQDLYQIDLQTGVMLPLRVGSSKMNAVAFDGLNGVLYWTDIDMGAIRRRRLTGGNTTVETIFRMGTPAATIEGLALDVANDKLYCCQLNISSGLIWEMNLNGSNRRVLIREPGQPRAIVVDPINRYMYWTDWGLTPAVVRANLDDGSGRTLLVRTEIKWPNALAIDFQEGVLYWGDAWHHRIERINLNGSGRRVVLRESTTNASYFAIALGHQVMYITDRKQRSVRKLDLRSGHVSNQLPSDIFDRLNGILFYNSSASPTESSLGGVTRLGSTLRPGARQSSGPVPPSTTVRSNEPVGRRTKAASTTTTPPSEETTSGDGHGQVAHLEIGDRDSSSAPALSGSSVVTVIVVVVIGVVVMTIVITIGVVIVKAKRNRSRLLLEKRPVVPISDRGINSYNYSPFASMVGLGGGGAGGQAGGSSTTSCSDDGEATFPCSPRPPAVRSSSCRPFIAEDALALNNIYSTVAGDYENINPYETIDDSFM